jgi:hypothetical protein
MLALRLASLVASTLLSDEAAGPEVSPPALASALLHASVRHEPGMQAALASCVHALQRAPALRPSLRGAALQPYHGLALELALSAAGRQHGAAGRQYGAELGAPSACYWASLLDGQVPRWTNRVAASVTRVAACVACGCRRRSGRLRWPTLGRTWLRRCCARCCTPRPSRRTTYGT